MRKYKFYGEIIIICIVCLTNTLYAVQLSPQDEKVWINFNDDMEKIYRQEPEYYPVKINGIELVIHHKNQVRDEKTCEKSPILCYGKPYGKYENGFNEYLGK